MAKFIQFNDWAVNIDCIETVKFYNVSGKPRISIWLKDMQEGSSPKPLVGDNAKAFIRWWNETADVYVTT